jgi:Ras-related protein Rab-11A
MGEEWKKGIWDLTALYLEIYRIVSNKALESSNNAIKPTGGQTILVSQTPDEQKQGGGCC